MTCVGKEYTLGLKTHGTCSLCWMVQKLQEHSPMDTDDTWQVAGDGVLPGCMRPSPRPRREGLALTSAIMFPPWMPCILSYVGQRTDLSLSWCKHKPGAWETPSAWDNLGGGDGATAMRYAGWQDTASAKRRGGHILGDDSLLPLLKIIRVLTGPFSPFTTSPR